MRGSMSHISLLPLGGVGDLKQQVIDSAMIRCLRRFNVYLQRFENSRGHGHIVVCRLRSMLLSS